MAIDLYYCPPSPPCRAVLMVAKQMGLEFNLIKIDVMKGEQNTPEFISINPQHCVPTIVDDGFTLWESRAIITYLVNKFGEGSDLYPQEPDKRAIVDRLLFFDCGTLFKAFADYFYPQLFRGEPPDEEKEKSVKTAFKYLDGFLEGQIYLVGDNLTIADLSILASVTFPEAFNYSLLEYGNVLSWMDNLKMLLPYYDEINVEPMDQFRKLLEERNASKD